MVSRIALVTSDVFIRRLTPALASFVKERRDFQIIDINRPWGELKGIIEQCEPDAIITEVLPDITERLVALGIPTVVADTDVVFPGAVSIDIDDHEVGATAGRFFLESGFRNLACVYLDTPYGEQRLEGFRGTMESSGPGLEGFFDLGSRHDAKAQRKKGVEGQTLKGMGDGGLAWSRLKSKAKEDTTKGRQGSVVKGIVGSNPTGPLQVEMFKRGMRETDGGIFYSEYRHTTPGGRHYMESWRDRDAGLAEWLRSLPKPVGVFAVHDPLGRTVCEVAREAGLQVPDEIAVVGANNDELVCGLSYPPLSSVAIPWDRIGALAGKWAQKLLSQTLPRKQRAAAPTKVKGIKEAILVQPGAVVVRASTGWGTAVEDGVLRRTLQYMRAQAANGATVASICSDLRVDRRQLERKMAEVMGCSPWEMLCRMRVESAKRLLVETDLPMALIAEQVGFGSAERFSVTFKRVAGTSPMGFRKKALGKE